MDPVRYVTLKLEVLEHIRALIRAQLDPPTSQPDRFTYERVLDLLLFAEPVTSPPEAQVSARQVAPTVEPPPSARGAAPTTQHRMAEMCSTLRIDDAQALDRSVATQWYVDARLREGWRFVMHRGRERRAVSFPGQQAMQPIERN